MNHFGHKIENNQNTSKTIFTLQQPKLIFDPKKTKTKKKEAMNLTVKYKYVSLNLS